MSNNLDVNIGLGGPYSPIEPQVRLSDTHGFATVEVAGMRFAVWNPTEAERMADALNEAASLLRYHHEAGVPA